MTQKKLPDPPELKDIEALRPVFARIGTEQCEGYVDSAWGSFPIYSFSLGKDEPGKPCIALVGGVHGLERVGTQILVAYMQSLSQLYQWDLATRYLFEHCRVVFLPLVNPVGMARMTRSNGQGIDLMRNAPVDAEEKPPIPLVGGHRYSPRLPWYRGTVGSEMEFEAKILTDFVERELFAAPFAIALDVHSGFGTLDRLWFPYAKTRRPFEHLAEMYALKQCFEGVYPYHVYCIEPQSRNYLTHGDLWDYLYMRYRQIHTGIFLPLCLEMGSWLWVKKNPRQALSFAGIFNPVLPHRLKRTLRRHTALIDFLVRATASHQQWLNQPQLVFAALNHWYGRGES